MLMKTEMHAFAVAVEQLNSSYYVGGAYYLLYIPSMVI